jgi:hypothetical protein
MLPWGTDQTWVDPIGFEGSGGVLFNDCTAETGACNSLYRSALGEALQDLNALDFEAMADCVGASLVSWQELEASSSAAMRRPYTVQEMAAGAAEAGDFAADRPAQLATFLGTAAPSPPVPTPCPLLRQRDGHLPPPPPPASAPTPASPTAGESSPASLPTTGARPSIGAVKAHAREIDVNVFAPVAGTLALKGTMAAKTGDALACAGQDQASAGDTLTISCRLTRAARERLGRRWLRLRLTATLASAADQTGSDSRSVRLSRQKPAATA